MLTKKNVLNTTRQKISPFAQLLLLFSYSIIKNPIFILLMIIPKYIPIFIITSNFTWKLKEETENNFYISNFLRKLELINILPKIDMMIFYYIGITLFIFEAIFFCYCGYYFMEIKKHRGNKIVLAWYPKLFFYLNALFSQYIVEYYSFTFMLFIKSSLKLPESKIFSSYATVPILTKNDNYNKIAVGILTLIQLVFLVLINLFTFYSFVIVNSSYRTKLVTLRYTHLYTFYFFVFFTDLSCIEYYEIFMSDDGRFKFKAACFAIIFVILLIDIISNVRSYEENNIFYFLIRYLNNYGFVSIVFEVISAIKDFHFTKAEILVFTFFKLFLTFFTLYMLIYFRSQFMLHLSKTYLFENYDETHLTQMLECFNYLLDQLIEINERTNNANEMINVLILHQKKCVNEQCKCKEIQPIPICGIKENAEFTNKLTRGFGFLMETCFANNKDSYNNIPFTLFLGEYFYNVKGNLILSYSLLQSCLNLNMNKMNFIQAFEINNSLNFYISKFKDKFKNNTSSLKFYKIFINIFERMEFNRNIIKYCNSFDELIDSKMSFENSLKFVTDPDTNEILSIDSIFLNREVLLGIIQKLSELSNVFKTVKKNLLMYSSERKGTEFYYLTFLFYNMFATRIPSEILKTFDNINFGGESFKNMDLDDMYNKFNFFVDKYIGSESAMNQLIIKFSKGIKIKYTSSNFCNQLGFIQSNLLGDDFANIFPKSLRVSHTRAMLHYIFVGENYFLKRSTYIFDANEHSMPAEIRGGALPHFGKSLMMILQILIKKNKNWSFILDNNFICLSISREIEENYFFNLNTLRKCDTDLIDLFDIDPKDLKTTFKFTLETIEKVKDELVYNDVEQYSKNLFSLNNNNELDVEDKLFVPNSKSLEISNSTIDLCDTSILFGKKMETIEFIRNKPIMIQNIIKALNKLGDSSFKDDSIRNLLKFLLTVKRNGGGNGQAAMTMENIIGSYEGLGLSAANNLTANDIDDLGENVENSTLQIMFKGAVKKLYDIPVYIFQFRDIMSNEDGYNVNHPMTFADTTKFQSTKIVTVAEGNAANKSMFNSLKFGKKGGTQNQSTFQLNQGSVLIAEDIGLNNGNKIISHANNIYDKNSKEYIQALAESKKRKKNMFQLEVFSWILMFLCFALSASNVIYQLIRIFRVQTIGGFYMKIQFLADKTTYLQSALLSETYQFGKFTDMDITTAEMLEYLMLSVSTLQEAIRDFYSELIDYDKKCNKNSMSFIYGDFNKIIKTWENISYYSDLFSELYYAIYLTNSIQDEDSSAGIESDVDSYFFKKYLNDTYLEITNKGKQIKTNFIKVVFFFTNNYDNPISYILDKLYQMLYDHLTNYLKSSRTIVFILEILWLVLNLAFFGLSLLLFSKFNRRIFKLIISMFLDNQKNEKGTFKNRPENFFMKQKINLYIILLHNFTMENKVTFQNFKTNFLKSGGYKIDNDINQMNSVALDVSKNNNTNNSTSVLSSLNNVTSSNLLNNPAKSNLVKINKNEKHDKNTKNIAIKEPKSSKEMKSNKDAAINNDTLLKLLNQQRITISRFMLFIVAIFLFGCLLIFYFHLQNLLTYNKDYDTIITTFSSFVTYFNTLPLIIGSVRRLIMTQSDIPDDLLTYSVNISNYEKKITEITSSSSFSIFERIKYFWTQVNLEISDEKIDKNYLCSEYIKCTTFITRDNGYCLNGVILGYELIAQKFGQIINDYRNLYDLRKRQNKIITEEDIQDYITVGDVFTRVQENIDYVFSQIQNQFYTSFLIDYDDTKNRLYKVTLLLNIIFFLFEIIVIVVMTCGLEVYMKKKEYLVKDGTFLFNSAFFKDPLPPLE